MAMSVTYMTINGVIVHEALSGGGERELTADPLGSLVKIRTSAANYSYSAEYWPYGEIQTQTGSNPTPWAFVGLLGYMRDLATMFYVRARYYRSALTRWMTVDPLWPRERAYTYVGGLPGILSDPSGRGIEWSIVLPLPLINPLAFPFIPPFNGNWNVFPITVEIGPGKCPKVEVHPIYGSYCGPQTSPGIGPGKDDVDACCKIHDDCFAQHGCTAFNQWFNINCRNCTQDFCGCLARAKCGWSIQCWRAKLKFMLFYACNPVFGNPTRAIFDHLL